MPTLRTGLAALAALVALTAAAVLVARRHSAPPPATAALPLGPAALGGGRYILGVARVDTVTLADGRFRARDGREILLLPVMAWGDLVGDERREAAVVVATQMGGSGTFYELVVLRDAGGRPVQIAHDYLGDRVAVEGLVIADRTISVHLRVHGPTDPACCPSQRVVRRLHVEGP